MTPPATPSITAALGASQAIHVEHNPLLRLGVFVTVFPAPLSELTSPEWLRGLLSLGAEAPLHADDSVRAVVRDLLRKGGYKPTGRGKPASEYLRITAAATDGQLASINQAVDGCNAVSLHSGLPISVVDLDLLRPPLAVGLGREGQGYRFNVSGQTIDVAGLLCLFDADGPCANGVKDAQRTKTRGETRCTLSLVWGSVELGDRTERTVSWYREVLQKLGAETAG